MREWVLVAGAIFVAAGCSADADRSGNGTRVPVGSGNKGTAGAGAGMGAAGGGGLGNIGMPMQPTAAMPAMPPITMTDAGGGECGAVSQTAQNMLQPVDIIIGVDTSGSMDAEIGFVQQNLNAFSQQITDSGIDVHVIMVATEGMSTMGGGGLFGGGDGENAVCIGPPLGSGMCPGDSNPPRYTHVNREVRSNDVLDVFIQAYPQYRQALRENSLKTFVAVTDDDARDEDSTEAPSAVADRFINAVANLELTNTTMWSNWRYSGIYCFTKCPDAAEVGAVHAELVARTMGVGGDLCLQDFKPVFDELARQVVDAVTLACDWEIPPPPAGETFDPLKTNIRLRLDGGDEALAKAPSSAECGDRDGWHYENDNEVDPTRVVACPATCSRIQAAQSASIDILFGCETMVLVPE